MCGRACVRVCVCLSVCLCLCLCARVFNGDNYFYKTCSDNSDTNDCVYREKNSFLFLRCE